MSKVSKQVIIDYFKSFLKQYSPLPKEQFTKIRSLVDEAECGCCQVVTIYWPESDTSTPSPSVQQIIFNDSDAEPIAQTSLEGTSPQRICVPRNTATICVNITDITNIGGTIIVTGSDGFVRSFTDEVGQACTLAEFPIDSVYIIATVEAP